MENGAWREIMHEHAMYIKQYHYLIETATARRNSKLADLARHCLNEFGRHDEEEGKGFCIRCGASLEKPK